MNARLKPRKQRRHRPQARDRHLLSAALQTDDGMRLVGLTQAARHLAFDEVTAVTPPGSLKEAIVEQVRSHTVGADANLSHAPSLW